MNQTNKTNEEMTNMEQLKEQASACGPECSCNSAPSGRTRWVVTAIVVAIACVLVARAVMKDGGSQPQNPNAEFALQQTSTTTSNPTVQEPETKTSTADAANADADKTAAAANSDADKSANKPVICGELIQSLGDLNKKASDKDGVFVFLAGKDAARNREIAAAVNKGTATLRGHNINMGVFTLKDGSSEYANLAKQVAPPCVVAMAKGRGASSVSDDVTESKLIQAYVTASSAGGCAPTGCGPTGCP